MKFSTFILTALLLSCGMLAKAQTTTPAFTDEDLKKYAITMDSVESMKKSVTAGITEMVQKNTVMSVQRYNELFKVAADEAKLAEAKATPEEIAFLKQVASYRTEQTAKINAAYQSMAKDYVGVKQFNAIRKSLESDSTVKAKYETITKEIEAKRGE
jgi:hypothetical protein